MDFDGGGGIAGLGNFNGYTPQMNNAIANNNANYAANQNYASNVGQQAQDNLFASGGGFGQQTADYAGAGAAYGRATGGFNGGDWGGNAYLNSDAGKAFLQGAYGTGGIGSDAARAPEQYQSPAVDWSQYFSQMAGPQSNANPNTGYSGIGGASDAAYDPRTYGGLPAGGYQPFGNPSMQNLLGYTPQQFYSGGGIGSDSARAPSQAIPWNPASGWNEAGWNEMYNSGRNQLAGMMASGGDTSYFDAGQPGSGYNPFGQINSGQVGQYDAFGGYQPQPTFDQRYGNIPGQPYGQGYFDNTFGSVSQNGVGSFNSRFPAPNTPGMTSSDQSEAARQQAIRDLMQTLGTTVAPAYDPHVGPQSNNFNQQANMGSG